MTTISPSDPNPARDAEPQPWAASVDWTSVAKRVDFISGVFLLLGFLYPRPYAAILGGNAALPWLAVVLLRMAGGAIEFPQSKRDAPRPNLDYPLFMPSLILCIRVLMDYDFVLDSSLLGLLTATVCLGTALFYVCLPKQPDRTVWAFALALGFLYALPMLFLSDVWLDRSTPRTFLSRIERKRITHSNHTEYNLRVSPWGPYSTPEEWTVGEALYDKAKEGDPIGILLHPGKWGIPWLRFRYPP